MVRQKLQWVPAGSDGNATGDVTSAERGFDCGGFAGKAVRERFRREAIRFSRTVFMGSTQSLKNWEASPPAAPQVYRIKCDHEMANLNTRSQFHVSLRI